jgi:hypothetical protein
MFRASSVPIIRCYILYTRQFYNTFQVFLLMTPTQGHSSNPTLACKSVILNTVSDSFISFKIYFDRVSATDYKKISVVVLNRL